MTKQRCGAQFTVDDDEYICSLVSGHAGGHGRIDVMETTGLTCETCVEAHRLLSAAGIADGDLLEKIEDLIAERDAAIRPDEPTANHPKTLDKIR